MENKKSYGPAEIARMISVHFIVVNFLEGIVEQNRVNKQIWIILEKEKSMKSTCRDILSDNVLLQ